MWMPYYSAIFLGLGMKVIDSTVFKRGTCPRRMGAALTLGFLIGANATNNMESALWREFDRDITRAFDHRFLNQALNVSGLHSSHTSILHNENVNDFSKPY